MKQAALLLTITIFSFSVQAQNKGMKFEHNSSWKEILAKAKAENKYIFVDCYTTWCGPCKYMSANIFPLENVGKFYNEKFINAKFQLDTSKVDNDEIKSRYADASFIAKEYRIASLPTYLFFNPDGELVHRDGGGCAAEDFIQKGVNALNPDNQYYALLKKYQDGQKDTSTLKKLINSAMQIHDDATVFKVSKDYFAAKPDLLTKDNMLLVYKITQSARDTGFNLIVNNLNKFETVVAKKELHDRLLSMILQSSIRSGTKLSEDEVTWHAKAKELNDKYPALTEDEFFGFIRAALVHGKINKANHEKNWADYADAVEKGLTYNVWSDNELNKHAWLMLQKCDDTKLLEKAALWSKKSFEGREKMDPGFIDTYANLLHKLGKTKEAIEWEEKGLAMEGKEGNKFQETINKMKKGEKTW